MDGLANYAADLRLFAAQLRRVEEGIPNALDRAAERAAEEAATIATVESPKDTGELANSINHRRMKRRVWEVYTQLDYAIPVHEGHTGYTVTPNSPDGVLRFVVNGEEVFTKSAEIPPRDGDPFLSRAMRKVDFVGIIEDEIDELFDRLL